jgi:Tol biopolymer transport system component
MSDEHDVDGLIIDWLAEGSDRTPDAVIESVRFAVRTTPQDRTLPRLALPVGARRSSTLWQLAAVVAAVAVIGSISFAIIGRPTVGSSERPPASIGQPLSGAPSQPAAATQPSSVASSGVPYAPFGYAGSGTIAFTREDASGMPTTWLVDPSGSHETPIGLSSGQYGLPNLTGAGCCGVFSPDGKQIAVGYTDLNSFRGPGELDGALVLNLDGTEASSIPAMCGGCASVMGINYLPGAWSPDGKWIATEVWSDTDPSRDGINLAPIDVAKGPRDWTGQVTGIHRDVPVAFSPDSKELLFVRVTTTDRRGALMKLDIAGNVVSRITEPGRTVFANDYFGPAATWSPDGTRIAFAATDAAGSKEKMQVFVSDADGGGATALTDPGSFITAAAWSPDGNWIAFDRIVTVVLHRQFVIRPDGSGLTDLTDGFIAGVCCARWSPDSRALLVAGTVADDRVSQLLIVPVGGGGISQVTTVSGFYSAFSWGAASR